MKRFYVILMLMMCGFFAEADTALVFGFDTTDNGTTELNGITYGGSKQSINFSGAVSATDQLKFDLLDEVDGTVYFSIGAVGDLLSLSGSIISSGGAFNIGGYGGGVVGDGSNNNYIDSSSEAWTFTFSQNVILTSVKYYGGDASGQSILINGTAAAGSPFNDDPSGLSIYVSAGDTLTFGDVGSDNGYAISDFNITVVPEPVAISLIGIGGLMFLVVRRMTRG